MLSVKTFIRRTLLITVAVAVLLTLFVKLSLHFIRPSHNSALPPIVNAASFYKHEAAIQDKVIIGLPAYLKIPKINVNASLDYVGLTTKGELDVPKGPTTAAWYDLGPRPGDKGSAVIDGHFGWKDGKQAVFDNLYKLQKGDNLYVEDDKGATTTFVVRELQTYGPSEDDSNLFVSNDGKAHLNLITCQGAWNKAQQSYSNRLAVFTDEVKG